MTDHTPDTEDVRRDHLLQMRFWTKVNVTDGCWLWAGETASNGCPPTSSGHRGRNHDRLSRMRSGQVQELHRLGARRRRPGAAMPMRARRVRPKPTARRAVRSLDAVESRGA